MVGGGEEKGGSGGGGESEEDEEAVRVVMVAVVDEHARHICRPRSRQSAFFLSFSTTSSSFNPRRRVSCFQLFLIPSASEKDRE